MSTIFVIGAGPKIGLAVPKLFVQNGFNKVGLASRTQANLEKLAAQFPSSTKVALAELDAEEEVSLLRGLDKLRDDLGKPDVIVFNASSLFLGMKPFADMSVDEFERHLKISLTAGFTTAKWALTNLNHGASLPPAVIFTGGGLAHNPRSGLAGLAIGKAAQLNLTRALRVEHPDIHWAVVTVRGSVDASDEYYSSPVIAKEYWRLYEQPKKDWEVEVLH